MEASSYLLHEGATCPAFDLPGVDGRRHALADFAKARVLVIAFSCNHCPYVQAYERRMIEYQRAFGPRGVQLVAINANEVRNYPHDAFPHMVARAKAQEYNFPYLRDDDQVVAKQFGAVCTPHFFLFDEERRLRYQGRLDDDKEGRNIRHTYLADATESVLAGRAPWPAQTWAIGCSIKWDTL
ncbi:MAG: thioredoxin family protein [Thermoplasmatota archaeon]